jgi:hypothetical protein
MRDTARRKFRPIADCSPGRNPPKFHHVSIRQARSRWRTLADKDECPVVDVLFSQETMNRLFDCFTFFNELDLLEVRLETLAPHVDYFILAKCISNSKFPTLSSQHNF